jgi:hypothetical protein
MKINQSFANQVIKGAIELFFTGPALEIQMVGEFLLKSKIWRLKPKYLVKIKRLRRLFPSWRLCEFHALYPPSAGPGSLKRKLTQLRGSLVKYRTPKKS